MTLPAAQLCHFGLFAHDLEKMVDFYTRAFGLVVTDRGRSTRGVDIAFLSGRPDEHHQLAIASGRPADATFSTINQVSFRVGSLDDLKRYHSWLRDERVKDLEPRDHSNAWSIYFSDPEEIAWRCCPTPWLRQPAVRRTARSGCAERGDPRQDRSHGAAGSDVPPGRSMVGRHADRLGQPERA